MSSLALFIFLCPLLSFACCIDSLADYPDYWEMLPDPIEEEGGESQCDCGLDLEEIIQNFVLETKKIHIPEYPDAFNPSVAYHNGRTLMCFRTYHPTTRATNEIGLVYLDEECNPVGTPKLLEFRSPDPYCLFKKQDPRLLTVENRLYIVYNNVLQGEIRRMLIGEIEFEGDDPFVNSSECLMEFEGARETRSEKNWVPFEYEERLHLAYSIVPHKILRPLPGLGSCETISCTLPSIKWEWGVLRGGTPALIESDEYLAFFHCSKSMSTKHSHGRNIPHYCMGAYTFSAHPPFQITRISPQPIVGQGFYSPPFYHTWKPLRVVFPGGFIKDQQFIWVFYGRQDHEMWVMKLGKQAMLENLVSVSSLDLLSN
ncbi:MAG TPA: hypothetical protein VLE95_04485 [Chlamydiales bacterium]|nr:hypothetical protein [Chlamydiales bacterium]